MRYAVKRGPGKRRLVQGARMAGLPEEVLFGVPKVVLVGEERALIENHRGVLEYTSERVRLRTDCGLLEIGGAELTLGHLGRSDLVVQGKITRLEYK
ncbi:MAG: YabP/YqfC family sporulation protein [Clostridia bacterium]|nr:YabP/YqfC family sporulation protein [Clostridia bacterium]